jgi:hypothetical protein
VRFLFFRVLSMMGAVREVRAKHSPREKASCGLHGSAQVCSLEIQRPAYP